MRFSALTMSTAANQLELAYGLLSVAAVRLEALQPPYVILDSRLNVSLTTKYWLLRIRLVSFLFSI
jgi:hypothetical protein